MIIERQEQVTEAVLAAMSGTPDQRLAEIMASLVRHLHAFARDVKLTENEFEQALAAVVQLGQLTNATHNEVVLAADVLGLSTLVCLMNNGPGGNTETAAALLGPFWRMNSPATPNGGSILRSPTPGDALEVACTVKDAAGAPVAGAEVDVWQASPVGMYENQDAGQADMNLRGKFTTDAEGRFWFSSVRPAGYPVPTHGVIGRLLAAQRREPYRPAHIHFLVYKPGFKTLISQVFLDEEDRLENDVVFGVTRSLVGQIQRGRNGLTLTHDFVLAAGEAHLPSPPIA